MNNTLANPNVSAGVKVGHAVYMSHAGRRIVGTVQDTRARGMFSLDLVLVEWEEFGEVWEQAGDLTPVNEAAETVRPLAS